MQRSFLSSYILLLGCLFQQSLASAQDSAQVLLVHSRYDVKDTSNEYLLGYHFRKGAFIKHDTLLHRSRVEGSKSDGRISVGLGDDGIIYNRYLYSSIGLLIDIQEKKLLREDANMELLEKKDRKLYFNNTFFNCTLDMYVYDLDKHTYKPYMKRPFERFCFDPELCAPDYNHFIESNYEGPGKTSFSVMDSNGKKRKLLIDTGARMPLYAGSRARGERTLVWTDTAHFIYPKYIVHNEKGIVWSELELPADKDEMVFQRVKHDTLPCCSVELNEVDIRNGKERFVATINGIYAPYFDDKIYRSGDQVVFRNRGFDSSQYFRIDRVNGMVTRYEPGVEKKFRIKNYLRLPGAVEDGRDTVLFNGQPIGKLFVSRYTSSDNSIAVFGSDSEEEEKTDYIFVWSTDNPVWQKIQLERCLGFFGWIKTSDN